MTAYRSVQHLIRTGPCIGSPWTPKPAPTTFPVVNPATGKTVARVYDCDGTTIYIVLWFIVLSEHSSSCLPELIENDAESAVQSAYQTFQTWSKTPVQYRSDLLYGWYRLTMENQEALATILTMENGKPLVESRAEIAYGASFIRWFAEEAKRVYGEVIPFPSSNSKTRRGCGHGNLCL